MFGSIKRALSRRDTSRRKEKPALGMYAASPSKLQYKQPPSNFISAASCVSVEEFEYPAPRPMPGIPARSASMAVRPTMHRPAPPPPARAAVAPSRPGAPNGAQIARPPPPPPRPNRGPGARTDESVMQSLNILMEKINDCDYRLGKSFKELRMMGVLDGRAQVGVELRQMKCEANMKDVILELLQLAEEKNRLLESIAFSATDDDVARVQARRALAQQINCHWTQKVNAMQHLPTMAMYEAHAQDQSLVSLSVEFVKKTMQHNKSL